MRWRSLPRTIAQSGRTSAEDGSGPREEAVVEVEVAVVVEEHFETKAAVGK